MKFGTRHLSVLGILLFAGIVWKTGFISALSSARLVSPFWLGVVLLTVLLEVLIRAGRWQSLASLYAKYPYGKALQTYLIGIAFGSITPAKLGDVVKILDLKNEAGVPLKKSLGLEVLDRLFDLLFLVLAGIAGLIAGYMLISGGGSSLLYLSLLLIALLLAGAFMLHGSSQFVYRLVYRFLVPERFKEDAKGAYTEFRGTVQKFFRGGTVYPVGALTLLSWLLIFIRPYFVALSLGIEIPWLAFLVFMPVVTVVELLPVSIMGLGVREGMLVLLFSFIGVAAPTMVLISILLLLLSIVPQTVVGYWLAIRKNINIGSLR